MLADLDTFMEVSSEQDRNKSLDTPHQWAKLPRAEKVLYVFSRLHPAIVTSDGYESYTEFVHRSSKWSNHNDYCRKIPVYVAIRSKNIITPEISSWENERGWMLNEYGRQKVAKLTGQSPRWHRLYFFADHFFDLNKPQEVERAINLANFAAIREHDRDFPNWFDKY